MTIYFTASIVGKKYYLKDYLKIIEILTTRKYQVISDHILNTTENQIRLKNREERLKFHKQLEKWINSCDFMVAEISFPSISVGYEISLALQHGKPVLVLYNTGDPPSLLAYHQDQKLVCERYSLDTLKEIIDDFINYIEGTNDTRFTFFITPEISSYLDKVSKKGKIPKSVYLRRLIEQDKDKSTKNKITAP